MRCGLRARGRKGYFISFEGIDGSGKSVQTKRLFNRLKKMHYPVSLIREPGGTVLSEKIRRILLDGRNHDLSAFTELLLYEAARSQVVHEKVLMELNRNHVVISDRFTDSSIAYQGYGRRMPIAFIREVNRNACRGVFPDRTFILDIPLEESQKRMFFSGKRDRMERENRLFFNRVRRGYIEIARREPRRMVLLNGKRPMAVLEKEILDKVLKDIKALHIEKKEEKHEND